MEVILRQDVEKLGGCGDVVKVADGYGRNYLLPQGIAMAATPGNKARIKKERKLYEAQLEQERAEYAELAEKIEALRYVAPRKVGENDALYGSVTSSDIGEFLASKGIEVDKRRVLLDEPIKKLGDHEVGIRLHPRVQAKLKILVSKEG